MGEKIRSELQNITNVEKMENCSNVARVTFQSTFAHHETYVFYVTFDTMVNRDLFLTDFTKLQKGLYWIDKDGYITFSEPKPENRRRRLAALERMLEDIKRAYDK